MKLPWIVSARFDAAFFTGSVAVPLALWAGFSAGLWSGVALYVLFQLLFNLPHQFQTWSMSGFDAGDRQANGRAYFWGGTALLAVLALPMWLSPDTVYPWVRDALIYWGYFHLVRQHEGFARMYERKAGADAASVEAWLYRQFLRVVCYVPLALRFTVDGSMRIAVTQTEIGHPSLPATWVPALWAFYAACLLTAVVHHAALFAKGSTEALPRALLLVAVTAVHGFAVLGVPDVLVAVAMVTTFHNVQYVGLTAFHNANRIRLGPLQGNWALGWLASQKWGRYAAVAFLYGVVILLPRALWPSARFAELPLSWVVAMHYFVDGRLWKFRRQPERARWLQLHPAGPSRAA